MFRFMIRDVLWLSVVVALGAAWRVEVSRYHRLHDAVQKSTRTTLFLFNGRGEFLGSADSKTVAQRGRNPQKSN
jgi:hypothetical protein